MAETGQRTLEHLKGQRVILSVVANGGAVAIEVEHDTGVWVTSDTIAADGVHEMTIGKATVRISPTGGATWRVHA
jgi:hypothetical protein